MYNHASQPSTLDRASSATGSALVPDSKVKRVVIVEDQTAVREMLAELFRNDPTYQIVGACGDGREACRLCLETKPDLVILDVKLPGLNGVDLLRRLAKQLRRTRFLVFSAYENTALVREMLEAGAHGFVEKTAGLSEFRKGIQMVANGGTYFGPAIAALLLNVVTNPASASGPNQLTDRERETLQLVAESHCNREIAAKLGISIKTVDNHRTNLMHKLNVHDVAGLTRYAIEVGLIDHHRSTPLKDRRGADATRCSELRDWPPEPGPAEPVLHHLG